MPSTQPNGPRPATKPDDTATPFGQSEPGPPEGAGPLTVGAVTTVSTVDEALPPAAAISETLHQQSVRDLAAQFEDEKPGRQLRGPVAWAVTGIALAVAVLVIWQVFDPLAQGSQYYLVIFLGGTLPLVSLSYGSGLRPFPA